MNDDDDDPDRYLHIWEQTKPGKEEEEIDWEYTKTIIL